ncbi:MAG: hypothetical protein KAS67_00765 [Thermoplasmata archaeon]|nr:hypothetical protein [Thermoplasmata archaeon]
MDVPSSLYATCTFCGAESICRVIKGKKTGKRKIKALVKCPVCEKAFDFELEIPVMVSVRTIISQVEESERTTIELEKDQKLELGDEIMIGDTCVQVTGIEVDSPSGTIRVEKAKAEEIKTLWTRYFNELVIKVSINMVQKTIPTSFLTEPDDEFAVGDDLEIGRRKLYIYKIKTDNKVLNNDGATAKARDVVRLYCKPATSKKPDYATNKRPDHSGDR